MIIDGSIHKSGYPIVFVPVLIKPIKDKHIMSPLELKMQALFKKMLARENRGKKKKKKGGGKSKYNIKMVRKFRRTRRKRGSGGDPEPEKESDRLAKEARQLQVELANLAESGGTLLSDEYKKKREEYLATQKRAKEALELERAKNTDASGPSGGRRKRSRRKRRRRTKKRKSRRRKKRSRRRRRKKR
jgi:hypothetical protein